MKLPVCIVEYDRCVFIPPEDKKWARPTRAYFCEWCKREDSYNGVLVFGDDPIPRCHEKHRIINTKISGVPLMTPYVVK